MSTQIEAITILRAELEAVFTGGSYEFLHPDDARTFQDVLELGKIAVRYYPPQLISDSERSGGLLWWFCFIDIATPTVDEAQKEGDKFLPGLTFDPASRAPRIFRNPRVAVFREQGFGRCNVQFRIVTDSQ